MRSSSEWLGSMRLLLVFASSVSLSVISKGLLLRYSAFDSRYNAFTRNKKIAIVSDEELAKRKKLYKSCLQLKHQRKNIYRMLPVYQ